MPENYDLRALRAILRLSRRERRARGVRTGNFDGVPVAWLREVPPGLPTWAVIGLRARGWAVDLAALLG